MREVFPIVLTDNHLTKFPHCSLRSERFHARLTLFYQDIQNAQYKMLSSIFFWLFCTKQELWMKLIDN